MKDNIELTHILTKPWKELYYGRWTWFIRANDDKIYALSKLVKIIGIDHQTLRNRLNNYHWSSFGILKKRFEPAKNDIHKKTSLDHITAGDLEYLNTEKDVARSYNMNKIPELTEFEKEFFK